MGVCTSTIRRMCQNKENVTHQRHIVPSLLDGLFISGGGQKGINTDSKGQYEP